MSHNLTQFSPEAVLSLYDNLEFVLRILIAAVLGLIIGLERTKRLKEAGMRTHCIVALSAAVFMILSKYAFSDLDSIPGVKGVDAARIAAQVVSGISFLGAGIIFRAGKNTIKGLTTAAGIWATAAVGMSIGAGLYWVGFAETALLLIIQTILHYHQYGGDALIEQEVNVVMTNEKEIRKEFQKVLEEHNCIIETTNITRDGEDIRIKVTIRSKSPFTYEQGMRFMRDNPEIKQVRIEDM